MPIDVTLRCACGKLGGAALGLEPKAGTRLLCYCRDCQAFARFLGRDDLLDRWGGSDIVHVAPCRVRFTQNDADALACVRLSEKGLHRWYCRHCKMAVGNTMTPNIPFVGLPVPFMDAATRDAAIGPPLGHVQTKAAHGDGAPKETFPTTARILGRSIRKTARSWLSGAGRPSPFFDGETPRAPVRVLTRDERRAVTP